MSTIDSLEEDSSLTLEDMKKILKHLPEPTEVIL